MVDIITYLIKRLEDMFQTQQYLRLLKNKTQIQYNTFLHSFLNAMDSTIDQIVLIDFSTF